MNNVFVKSSTHFSCSLFALFFISGYVQTAMQALAAQIKRRKSFNMKKVTTTRALTGRHENA